LADTRPDLVKAIVAVEPNGPPFYELILPHRDAPPAPGAPWYRYGSDRVRSWGLTRLPLSFSPDAAEPPLPELQARPEASGLVPCWLQAGIPRTPPQLAQVPIGLFTAEASFRTASDHCTALFLRQAGVPADHIRLPEHGVRGNGHMMMLERNSSQVAAVIAGWLESKRL
jgi:hypothetical protein